MVRDELKGFLKRHRILYPLVVIPIGSFLISFLIDSEGVGGIGKTLVESFIVIPMSVVTILSAINGYEYNDDLFEIIFLIIYFYITFLLLKLNSQSKILYGVAYAYTIVQSMLLWVMILAKAC